MSNNQNVFLYRAPSGIPGEITRQEDTSVESGLLDKANSPPTFGVPVKLVNGVVTRIAANDKATDFFGVLSRVAPAISGNNVQTYEDALPNPQAVQGIVVRGYVNVVCAVGTPVRNGAVYMRTVAVEGKDIGDFEATPDGVNSVLLPGVTWASNGLDASKIAEIRIK